MTPTPTATPVTRAWLIHPELRAPGSSGSSGAGDRRTVTSALDEAVSLARALPFIALQGAGIVRLGRPQAAS